MEKQCLDQLNSKWPLVRRLRCEDTLYGTLDGRETQGPAADILYRVPKKTTRTVCRLRYVLVLNSTFPKGMMLVGSKPDEVLGIVLHISVPMDHACQTESI